MNTWNSLNGKAHTKGVAGIEYFAITTRDGFYLNTVRSIIYEPVTPKEQMKQSEEEEVSNKNQILINDPDGIQILIKSE